MADSVQQAILEFMYWGIASVVQQAIMMLQSIQQRMPLYLQAWHGNNAVQQ